MPRPGITEAHYDFKGGRNTTTSPDQLQPTELIDCTNARVDSVWGGFSKRLGSRRMHSSALPGEVKGLTVWDSPSGKQIAAIAATGGVHHLYTKPFDLTTAFTDQGSIEFAVAAVSPAGQNHLPTFAQFRAATSGAPLVLYMAYKGWYNKWDGTTLTRLTGTTNAPVGDLIQPYHTRMFARDANYPKHLFWSRIGDASYWTTGNKADGGSAMLDTLTGEEITGMTVIGSSLLITTPSSTIRFTGISSDDIVIQQDTEGISSDVGAYSTRGLIPVENIAAMISERGLYAVNESGLVPLGDKIKTDWELLDKSKLDTKFQLAYDQTGRQILVITPNGVVYAYSTRLQIWQGPYTYPFEISSAATCTVTTFTGQPSPGPFVIVGGIDGFVRLLEIGQKDDVLSNGSGGSNITMNVIKPIFRSDDRTQRSVKHLKLQAQLSAGGNLNIGISFDGEAYDPNYVYSKSSSLVDYKVDLGTGYGYRGLIQFTDSSDQPVRIDGFTLYGWDMLRE